MYHGPYNSKFHVSVGLSDIKIIGPVVSHCKNTLHQRDVFFHHFPFTKIVSEASKFHQKITAVATDSNVKATKDQKTCLQTAPVLPSGCSVDPTHSLSQIFDIYSKISQPTTTSAHNSTQLPVQRITSQRLHIFFLTSVQFIVHSVIVVIVALNVRFLDWGAALRQPGSTLLPTSQLLRA